MGRMPEVGETVDGVFRIEKKLDGGNFGAIFRALELPAGRRLALKVLKPAPHDEEQVRKRFEREARLVYRLDHLHVVQVLYYGETASNLPYMAMEYLEGTDLRRLILSGHRFDDRRIRRIGIETLSGLAAAHDRGVLHRDLKPGNIFVVDDGGGGYVKILDFGFAKSAEGRAGEDLTAASNVVGSPAYMAPELVHKEEIGPHSDLYAVGLILGEMVAGRKLVDFETINDTLLFQASDQPVDIPEAVRRSPFEEVVSRAVQKPIGRRFESAPAMAEALAAGRSRRRDTSSARAAAPVDGERSDPPGRPASTNQPQTPSAAGPGRDEALSAHDPKAGPGSVSGQPGSAPTPRGVGRQETAARVRRESGWGLAALVSEVLLGLALGGVGVTVLIGVLFVIY